MRNKMYTNALIELSRKMLENAINYQVKGDFAKMKKIVWGAGESGKNFIILNKDFDFSYIVDTRKHLQGKKLHGLRVCNEDELLKEEKENTVIFLPTVSHQIWKQKLYSKGFNNIIVPCQINASGVGFPINRSGVVSFISWLNDNKINYVCQKYISKKIDFFSLRDFDILVNTDHIPKLINCPHFFLKQSSNIISVDVMWSKPIGTNQEIPFYTYKLSSEVLKRENQVFTNNVWTVKPDLLIFMYLYHIILHKGENSALEKNKNFIMMLMKDLRINFSLDLEGIFSFVQKSEYEIPIDFARMWAKKTKSEFLNQKVNL